MAIKEYQFWRQYKIPAGEPSSKYIDGVYIDSGLFENNVPIVDGMVHIVASPQSADPVARYAEFRVPTFANGKVGSLSHQFHWSPSQVYSQSFDLDYGGHPYGMGLNTICAEFFLLPAPLYPLTYSIWFNVLWKFSMEVG
jgi:hypothetical protein